jgi:two-component system sensor histidine kinase DegS
LSPAKPGLSAEPAATSDGGLLRDRVDGEIEELKQALPRLDEDWTQAGERLANAIVIRRHLSRNADRFSPHERDVVVEQAEQLAARRAAAEAAITAAQARLKLLMDMRDALEDWSPPASEGQGAPAGALEIHQAVEAERLRVARDLHDGPAQVLTNLMLEADILERVLTKDPEQLPAELQEFKNSVRNAVADMRRFMFDLRPDALDDLGLVATLRRFTKEYQDRTGIICRLNLTGTERRLPADVEEAIYRVVQEALNNVKKHAQANTVEVNLEMRDAHVRLRVRDDGTGFDPSQARPDGPRKLGVLGMQERLAALGGTLQVTSRPGAGTEVEAEIDVPEPEARAGGREKRGRR